MSNLYTSIDQCKILKNLGLKPETADMHYAPTNNGRECSASLMSYNDFLEAFKNGFTPQHWEVLPCWSAARLIELMPTTFHILRNDDGRYYIQHWYVDGKNNPHKMEYDKDDLMDLCFSAMCWFLGHGYFKDKK